MIYQTIFRAKYTSADAAVMAPNLGTCHHLLNIVGCCCSSHLGGERQHWCNGVMTAVMAQLRDYQPEMNTGNRLSTEGANALKTLR